MYLGSDFINYIWKNTINYTGRKEVRDYEKRISEKAEPQYPEIIICVNLFLWRRRDKLESK